MGSSGRGADWQSLVDLIYTEYVEDLGSLMDEVFGRYRRVCKFSSAAFLPVDPTTGALRMGVSVDHDVQRMAEYLERYQSLDPYMINGPTLDTMNEVFVFSEVASGVPGFRRSEFPVFMGTVPYADALAVLLATAARPVGVVTVHRTAQMAEFSARDIRDFAWLTRHLAKGIDLRERAANTWPKPGLGLMAVDSEGNILWLNGLARRIVDETRIDPRTLCRIPPGGRQYKTRRGAFHARCEPLGRNSVYVRRGWIAGRRSVQEAPLHVPQKRPPAAQSSALMVSFTRVSTTVDGGLASLDLTPAEKKVAGLLLRGLPYGRIAVALGVEETTVRTHVYKIFTKAGVRTRHEFMAMLVALDEGPESNEGV